MTRTARPVRRSAAARCRPTSSSSSAEAPAASLWRLTFSPPGAWTATSQLARLSSRATKRTASSAGVAVGAFGGSCCIGRPHQSRGVTPGRWHVRPSPAPIGSVRVAEVAGHRQLAGEPRIGGELGPPVEGDGPAGVLGQAPERLGDARDHRRRALVLVRQQEGEPALALHERGHVGLAGLLAEDQQVALPVAESLARPDLGRPVLDPALARDRRGARLAAVAAAAPPPGLGQVAEEAVLAALRPVDVAVDRLVADGRPSVRLLLEPTSDLLR